MSARKVPSRCFKTPETGGKVTTKNKPPTVNLPLNSTNLSRTTTNLFETTFSSSAVGASAVPKLIAPDWDLQCDISNSQFLRALLSQNVVTESILNYQDEEDDQMSQQAEYLSRAKLEECKLTNEIKNIEIQKNIENLYDTFTETLTDTNSLLKVYSVEKNLKRYVGACKSASNKLYLKNIQPFEAQEDYDKFSALLETCTDTLRKLIKVIGNSEAIIALGEQLRKYLELQQLFLQKEKMVTDMESSLSLLVLKTASDKFARIGGYDL